MGGASSNKQLELPLPSRHGGARKGAGRPRLPPHARHTPHRSRARHRKANPVHVTLRARLSSLRTEMLSRTVLAAARASNRDWFRITHYSIQENHIHLIVEATDTASLSSGMRGLMVRTALRVNRRLGRRGQFWADRWHGASLGSLRQVRNALVYVIQNRRKHASRSNSRPSLDPLSSAEWFDGFREPIPRSFHSIGPPSTSPAQTWLLRIGWKKRGLISQTESPKESASY